MGAVMVGVATSDIAVGALSRCVGGAGKLGGCGWLCFRGGICLGRYINGRSADL